MKTNSEKSSNSEKNQKFNLSGLEILSKLETLKNFKDDNLFIECQNYYKGSILGSLKVAKRRKKQRDPIVHKYISKTCRNEHKIFHQFF